MEKAWICDFLTFETTINFGIASMVQFYHRISKVSISNNVGKQLGC